MGSLLIGTKPFIRQARRIRKLMGGGLRQAGFMAATGVYALEHHVQRLEEDHRHAREIAGVIEKQSYCGKLYPVETNIILFETALPNQASTLIRKLEEKGIKAIALSPQLVRMVLYLNITPEMVATTIKAVQSIN
jgi:threonine aldolase